MAETKKRTYKSKTVKQFDSLVNENVDFGEVEDFKVNAPAVNAQSNAIIVTSNYEELSAKVKGLVAKYGSLKLTEDNVNYVKTVKSHFVSLRTSIERERKEWAKVYLDPAKKTVNAMCDDLQKLVAEGENALGKQLDAYDQRRKDELTEVLEGYKSDLVERYKLRSEYADMVVLKDKYYNKTQNEEDSLEDLELQVKEMLKKQTELDSAMELIDSECEGTTLIKSVYVEQLKYKSVTEIIMQIKRDKKESQKLFEELKTKEENNEKIVIGEPVKPVKVSEENNVKSGKETRTRHLVITYSPEQAEVIARFFTENNIQYRFIKE